MRMVGKLLMWFCVATVLCPVCHTGDGLCQREFKGRPHCTDHCASQWNEYHWTTLHNVWAKAKEVPVPTREELSKLVQPWPRNWTIESMALQRERTLLDEMRKQLEMDKKLFDDRRVALRYQAG